MASTSWSRPWAIRCSCEAAWPLTLTSPGHRLHGAVSGGFATISEVVDHIERADECETEVSTSTAVATEWLPPGCLPCEVLPKLTLDIRCLDRNPELVVTGTDVHIRLGDGNWPGVETVMLWLEATPGTVMARPGPRQTCWTIL
jgi:LysR family glycine cleavage system transcriptional activator